MKYFTRIILIISIIALSIKLYPIFKESRTLTLWTCGYLMIGTIVSATIDYSIRNLMKEPVVYTNIHRIYVILTWPITLIISLILNIKKR
jgi:hypothetical protein